MAATMVAFVFLLLPVFYMFYGVSFFKIIGATTFTFLSFVTSRAALNLLATSLEFAVPHAVIAVGLGVLYAWFIARTDIPGKKIFELLPLLGLTIPFVVKAFSWTFLFAPTSGLINVALKLAFGSGAPVFNVFSMLGLILAAASGGIPLAYLITLPAMRSIDFSLEEASKISGNGLLRTLRKVTLPLVMPAVLSAFLLITISGFDNFDYPFIIGQPAGIHVLATEVYFYAAERSPPSYGDAAIISAFYILITLILVGVYIWMTHRSYKYTTVTGKPSARTLYKLGSWKVAGVLVCFAIMAFDFFLPFAAIVFVSLTSLATFAGNHVLIKFNFPQAYITAIHIPLFYQALTDTLEIALSSAVLITIAGTILAYAALRNKTRGARFAEIVSTIPLAFPGIVYAVGLFWMFLILPGANSLFGTIWPLMIALTVVRLPAATRIISANLVQISKELEETSQVVGSSLLRTLRKITLPLITNAIADCFGYNFVDSMRELGAVIMLSSPSALAFTVLITDYYEAEQGSLSTVAAASVMLT
ncbi:MAG: ABC transporter permease, partial [Acidimicrobiales bacterium]